jgi:hypothetical protein
MTERANPFLFDEPFALLLSSAAAAAASEDQRRSLRLRQ